MRELINRYAKPGQLVWIGLRPASGEAMVTPEEAEITQAGIDGDRHGTPGKRAVTLIQWEHMAVIASMMGTDCVSPALLRRNLCIQGINLIGLRNREFRLGQAVLKGTGLCAPCSRMEDALGEGGFAAMRGHGGITAEVVSPGTIRIGDAVKPLTDIEK